MSRPPYPPIHLLPRQGGRVRRGHPWVYANELNLDAEAKAVAPGSLVTLCAEDGSPVGIASFNWKSLIAARLFTPDAHAVIDAAFLAERLEAALRRRERWFDTPFYRLVHSEGDGLPGLIIDRLGDILVGQINTAAMAGLEAPLLAALDQVLDPRAVVWRNDRAVRALEGLDAHVRIAKGAVSEAPELDEDGVVFPVDVLEGQKTGWFFDQRPARAMVARLARGRRVLDLYAYSGGFAVRAAAAGAAEVVAIERSQAALALAQRALSRNALDGRCDLRRGEAFAEMGRLGAAGEGFDIVIADPPAFVRSRKELGAGLKGYRKLARLAGALVAPGGLLFLASCSHLVDGVALAAEIRRGLTAARRSGRILASGGAGPDHPVHAFLPETAYLKWQLIELD